MNRFAVLAFVLGPLALATPALGQPAPAAPPAAAAPAAAAPAKAAAPVDEGFTPAEEVDFCEGCHHLSSMELNLPSGEVLSLKVDEATFKKSTHKKLACTDCHQDLKGVEGDHAKKPLRSKREFAINYSEGCKKCHPSNYADTQDSVHHARNVAGGKLDGAVCADCHGSHDISSPNEPRTRIAKTCSKCHPEISAAYQKSVHGRALADDGNEDVPTCVDCHAAHKFPDARAGAWRVKVPEMCGTCHANAKLMKKYNLSPDVLKTYLADFHGVTVQMLAGQKGANPVTALCIDCHGVHDITRVKDPNSRVIKANLLNTCNKCHPNAKADFPSAWLSHYEPSFKNAPFVYMIKLMYIFFIPFMIGGLAVQIVMHLYRLAVNR